MSENIQPAAALRHISKSYGKKRILDDISLEVSAGTCVGILGENGCGKSTLLSVLAGTLTGAQGSFFYGTRDLLANRKLRASVVGYVPQGTPLIPELTALDNLRLWYDRRDQLKAELSDGVLAMLGIDSFLKVPVSRMSGGMKKRLAIGCAMAGHPPEYLPGHLKAPGSSPAVLAGGLLCGLPGGLPFDLPGVPLHGPPDVPVSIC